MALSVSLDASIPPDPSDANLNEDGVAPRRIGCMEFTDCYKMADQSNSHSDDALDFIQNRIGRDTLIWRVDERHPLPGILSETSIRISTDQRCDAETTIDKVVADGEIRGLQLNDTFALIVARMSNSDADASYLMSIVAGPEHLARSLVSGALESWSLSTQVAHSTAALTESNKLLVRAFEERSWLRGFARNATSICRSTNTNVLMDGILDPLAYLLRSAGLFLIVCSDETERSGLASKRFGQSNHSIETIARTLESVGVVTDSEPLVHNNLNIETHEGTISSVVAVTIGSPDQPIGVLAAVNRLCGSDRSNQSAYEVEFGSSDAVLLQEAATLLATQVQNVTLLMQSNEVSVGTLHAMSRAIEARDRYTQGHSERVAQLSFELAQILGLSNEACQEIYLAGILHDVGKIGMPDHVLHKEGDLTNEEFAIIREHPEIGHRIVKQLKHLRFVLPGILYHHERWDGGGYPHGLVGLSIPVMARVMAVADAFDAMTSSRPYRTAMSEAKAHAIINEGAGTQWDAEVVSCFNAWIDDRLAIPQATSPSTSVIYEGSPVADRVQAAMTLVH